MVAIYLSGSCAYQKPAPTVQPEEEMLVCNKKLELAVSLSNESCAYISMWMLSFKFFQAATETQ